MQFDNRVKEGLTEEVYLNKDPEGVREGAIWISEKSL